MLCGYTSFVGYYTILPQPIDEIIFNATTILFYTEQQKCLESPT